MISSVTLSKLSSLI